MQGRDRGWDVLYTGTLLEADILGSYYVARPTGLLDRANLALERRLFGSLEAGIPEEFARPFVRPTLPSLQGSVAGAFEGEPLAIEVYQGRLLYRAKAEAARGPGRWFATQPTQSAYRAQRWWNVRWTGNPVETLRTYEVVEPMSVYYGRVSGGRGTQILISNDIPIDEVIRLVGEVLLR